jgi:serine/threonine protein kinase
MSADDKTRILPNVAPTHVGTQLSGIYELDERIASGGMGEVYRGHNIQTGDLVAIKIVLPELASDQTILSLFRKEASILNHLSHDAIVRYHVFTIDPGIGRPYLAMEFVNGESLFDVIGRRAMPTEEVRKLCHRLASGLSAVHEAGAVHRDLSPDNIILPGGSVERAKIIDFGIARSAAMGETLIGGKFAGKYNYVSPEQLGLYDGEVSERSDIYSLGLVLAAALRGKPLEMSGSQFEILEKRRTVPDLSDIDGSLRPIIEAMLQPDPKNRPASMAAIARATRDDPVTDIAGPIASMPPSRDEPRFVPHIPPDLSRLRPAPAATSRAAGATRSTDKRNIAIAVLAAFVVVSGAGAYLGGFLTPQRQPALLDGGEISPPGPDLSSPPTAENTRPSTQAPEDIAVSQTRTKEAATPSASQPETANDQGREPAQPAGRIADARKPAGGSSAPSPPSSANKGQSPEAVQPNAVSGEARRAAEATESVAKPRPPDAEPNPLPAKPSVNPLVKPLVNPGDAASGLARDAAQLAGEPQLQTQTEVPSPSAGHPNTAGEQGVKSDQPAMGEQGETVVATSMIKPQVPATDAIDAVAERISWLRDYRGGDCFYATVTSATDKAVEIEGFGTAVEPFEQMLKAFQAQFHVEPEVSVRLIDPAQCEVTQFLRTLDATGGEKPQLELDRTSVPNGSAISGTLETLGGLRSSLLLIDHKGMAFNLDERVTVETGKASFSIPIGLSAVDQAAGKAVPQIIVAVTGTTDIQAAAISSPTPAAVALPKILAEIKEKGLMFSATAKYFRLGG